MILQRGRWGMWRLRFMYKINNFEYNSHYDAVMSYFSSNELNRLKAYGILVWKRNPINKNILQQGLGAKLTKKLIKADEIGLLRLI